MKLTLMPYWVAFLPNDTHLLDSR